MVSKPPSHPTPSVNPRKLVYGYTVKKLSLLPQITLSRLCLCLYRFGGTVDSGSATLDRCHP